LRFLARFFSRTLRESDPVPEIGAQEPANAAQVEILLPAIDPPELTHDEPQGSAQPDSPKLRFTDDEHAKIRERNNLPTFDPALPTLSAMRA